MKKNKFFKILVIIMAVIALLTWLIPAGNYSGEFIDSGFQRLGFVDFCQYLLLPFFQSMFIEVLIFLLAVGAFYGVLSKTGAYKNALEKIAKKSKKKGTLFLVITAALIAILSSVGGYGLLLFIFIPALISIILLMGYDKVTAFLITFGAMLIGVIGATFGGNYIDQTLSTLNLTYTSQIYLKLGLFVVSFVIYIIFTIKNANKKSKVKEEKYEDKYLGNESSKKKATALYIIFGLIFILFILGCTNWYKTFGIEAFNNFHNWLLNISIKDFAIFSNILGSTSLALGNWSYFQMSIVLVLASLLIAKIYNVKAFENMVDGIKVIVKPALLVLFSYGVLILIVNSGIFTTLMSYLLNPLKKFNVIAIFVSTLINIVGSFLHVEMMYIGNFYLPYLAGSFVEANVPAILNVMTQSIYGLTMFVAPTSLFLLLGLSYLEIPYTEWLKKIWKLVVILLLITLITLVVMLLVL